MAVKFNYDFISHQHNDRKHTSKIPSKGNKNADNINAPIAEPNKSAP